MSTYKFVSISSDIFDKSELNDFAGYDPFDTLNSPVFRLFPKAKNTILGLAFLQINKRSPVNFRALIRVPKKRNPKGIALFIMGMIYDYKRTKNKDYLAKAIALADWLLDNRCDSTQWKYNCWGYHFDWKARAFFVPEGKPNVISTLYVSRALYELGEALNRADYIDAALNSAGFISDFLYNKQEKDSFISYIPGEKALVHNANLWGAAWLAFVGKKVDNDLYIKQAHSAMTTSIDAQLSDGSWRYGTAHHHQFIDGFHTGYNLEALYLLKSVFNTHELDTIIDKGLDFYRTHFFTEEGDAKYYHNNMWPLDFHNVAQAVFTLLAVSKKPEDKVLCSKVLSRAIDTLYLEKKQQFIYQKTRHYTNKINYIRWTQAWAYFALAFYNYEQSID